MSETKQVTGVSKSLSENANGWTEFEIDAGTDYPYRLSTKRSELIELGRAAKNQGALAVWTYNESPATNKDGTPRINEKSGKQFINYYLEGVEVGGVQNPAGSVATPAAAQGVRTYTPDLKDRMIVRQTALKAAAETYGGGGFGGVKNEDGEWIDRPLAVIQAAQRFETWVYRDIDPLPSDAGRPPLFRARRLDPVLEDATS